jgi:hypothetical protein
MIAKIAKNIYGLWVMGYGYKIPANQLGSQKMYAILGSMAYMGYALGGSRL